VTYLQTSLPLAAGFWRDGPAFGVPAAAGPGRLKVELPTCSVFVDPADVCQSFQTMVGTSFPLNSDRRPRRIYLAYQQFFRVNNVA